MQIITFNQLGQFRDRNDIVGLYADDAKEGDLPLFVGKRHEAKSIIEMEKNKK